MRTRPFTTDLESQTSSLKSPVCDLCGAAEPQFILSTPRLDGPLLRCTNCGLYYVALPQTPPGQGPTSNQAESEFVTTEMRRLAARARELELVEPHVEEGEGHWRQLTAEERLNDLLRVTGAAGGGRLLEIGCSTGDFLAAARRHFAVQGVEADAASCTVTQSRGIACFNGALADAQLPDAHFDAVALYHVIEHLPSPTRTLLEIRRVLRPGGWLVVETPDLHNRWFRLLGARWRQFIPDHIFFFTPQTITRACDESGFDVRTINHVGKAMSTRLFISRLGRYHQPLSRVLMTASNRLKLSDRTLRLNFGDVMRVYAKRR